MTIGDFSMRLLEADRVPDWLIRRQIRALVADRLREATHGARYAPPYTQALDIAVRSD